MTTSRELFLTHLSNTRKLGIVWMHYNGALRGFYKNELDSIELIKQKNLTIDKNNKDYFAELDRNKMSKSTSKLNKSITSNNSTNSSTTTTPTKNNPTTPPAQLVNSQTVNSPNKPPLTYMPYLDIPEPQHCFCPLTGAYYSHQLNSPTSSHTPNPTSSPKPTYLRSVFWSYAAAALYPEYMANPLFAEPQEIVRIADDIKYQSDDEQLTKDIYAACGLGS